MSNAERCVVEGIKAVRQVEAPYQLPHYLGIVVSTSFSADDRLTAELMKHFYTHLSEGMEEGEALNRAKLDILGELGPQTSPYYWAGFSLVGAGNGQVFSSRPK